MLQQLQRAQWPQLCKRPFPSDQHSSLAPSPAVPTQPRPTLCPALIHPRPFPQDNLLWERLSAREHLMFYGRLKVRPPLGLCGCAAVYCVFAQPAGTRVSQAVPCCLGSAA